MSTLRIQGLRAGVEGNEILRGIDLEISSGEVHAIMGPNDSGKNTLSHVIMGRPGYEVLGGTVTLDGLDLLALPPYERARAGLFLALQYPTEVPGVSLQETIEAAFSAAGRDSSTVGARLTEEAERWLLPATTACSMNCIRIKYTSSSTDVSLLRVVQRSLQNSKQTVTPRISRRRPSRCPRLLSRPGVSPTPWVSD